MARGMLSSAEMEILQKNPYVEDVSRQRILYTYEFKCFFMEQYLAGKRPVDIFREAVEACPEYANVKRLCEALNISASGYYAYCKS